MKTIQQSNGSQATEQGSLMIQVYVKDVINNVIVDTRWIKRAELAKLFHENKVTGSQNNKFIIGY